MTGDCDEHGRGAPCQECEMMLLGVAAYEGLMGMAIAIHRRGIHRLENHPAYRSVPITVVLHLEETIPNDWEDGGRFFIEENHCLDNYVSHIHREMREHPNYCQTCHRGEAFLGHIPLAEIREVQDAMPDQGFTALP